MTWTRPMALQGGVTTTVEHRGRPTDQPVLGLHGLGGDRVQALGLVAEKRPRLAFDFRAHGDAVPVGPLSLLSFQGVSDDVADMLEQLGIARPLLLVGISMGAAVALRFALDHPDRVPGLVLIRPAWLDEPYPPHLRAFPEIARLLQALPLPAAREAFTRSPTYEQVAAESEPMAASLLEQFDRPMAAERAAVLERMPASTPVRRIDELAQLRVPAVVVACDRDPVHPIHLAQRLHEALPGSRYTQVPSKAEGIEAYTHGVMKAVEDLIDQLGPTDR